MTIASETSADIGKAVEEPVDVYVFELSEAGPTRLARYIVVQVPSGEPLPGGLEALDEVSTFGRPVSVSESGLDELLDGLKGEVEFIEDPGERSLCVLRKLASNRDDEELFEETWRTGVQPEDVTRLKEEAEARGEFAFSGVSDFVIEREISRFLRSREAFAQSHRSSPRKTG